MQYLFLKTEYVFYAEKLSEFKSLPAFKISEILPIKTI